MSVSAVPRSEVGAGGGLGMGDPSGHGFGRRPGVRDPSGTRPISAVGIESHSGVGVDVADSVPTEVGVLF